MGNFKWRHCQGEVILWAVRWYCRYGVSYRDAQFEALFAGLDWRRVRAVETRTPQAVE